MKRILRHLICLLLLLSAVQTAIAQKPFYNEVQQFKKQDSAQLPPKNAVLFIGSSSFTFWKDVQNYFPKSTIINRGFGGSSLTHVIDYADDVIFPYHPKQIVIYCGENDLASSDTVTPMHVLQRFQQLFQLIKSRYKKIPIVFVSIKPSPSRALLMPKMEESNRLIKRYLSTKKKTAFVDVYNKMLLPDKTPDPSLFVKDNLHMNAKGYAIWQSALEPHLLKR